MEPGIFPGSLAQGMETYGWSVALGQDARDAGSAPAEPKLELCNWLVQVKHFGLIMWTFFHLNLVTQEFQPACHYKSSFWSRDKEETRKKLFSELYEATLNLAYGSPQGAGLQWMFFQLHFI